MTDVGVALFDDSGEESGWASISGAPASRFVRIEQLDQDAVWITNLEFADLVARDWLSFSHLRRRNFLRDDITTVAWDLGVDVDANAPEASRFLAGLINRVWRLVQSEYGATELSDTLIETIARVLVAPGDDTSVTMAVQDAMRQGFRPIQQCDGRVRPGEMVVSLHYPYAGYARHLLAYPSPVGPWRDATAEIARADSVDEQLSEVLRLVESRCGMFLVDYPDTRGALASLMQSGLPRRWLTVQELVFVMRVTQQPIDVVRCVVSDGATILADHPRWKLSATDRRRALAPSYGLVAHAHWQALATNVPDHGNGRSAATVASPRGVILRGWDRLSCLRPSLKLHHAGYRVVSYGNGAVNVAVSPSRVGALSALAATLNLCTPIGLLDGMGRFADAFSKEAV